ncbi:uncharacterized protein LOC110026207 [Phalaenopsis equestris]|uniref:uncharacterized protein LOC110026207 n=1 Tax=Phalaenopsis equestris TaxID=78828 RepID=UPI0009E1AA3F|nr:uncharacterized protein LOC110026207 [Phalaenopsis equestris]
MAEPPPFLRGPMYSTYSELREWKLRMKKAGLNPATPIPVQAKQSAAGSSSGEQAVEFRKENRKASPLVNKRFEPSKMAPPPTEMRRAGSVTAGKREEKGGGVPRGGSVRADDLAVMRNFCSYQEQGTRNVEEGKGRREERKGIFGKTFTGFRRSTAKAAGWLG